jgi:6-pyruvoyltetrahydropterin/6-carboxytetrahydropterin synthase
MFEIQLRHNFETAHRLSTPNSPEKCRSIHGHSWWATVTIEGPKLDEEGILVEFGALKKRWRRWLDDNLDHHLVLSDDDPLLEVLEAFAEPLRIYTCAENPTTEVLASLVASESQRILKEVEPSVAARVSRLQLKETRVNQATYIVPSTE